MGGGDIGDSDWGLNQRNLVYQTVLTFYHFIRYE